MVDVEITRVRTREERDAEGWANAIVLSSDEDEPAPPSVTHASAVGPSRSTPVSVAPPSGALGKRPLAASASSAGYNTQPDVKQHKVAGGATWSSCPPALANGASPSVFPPAWAAAVARPTELTDGAVYGAPPPFAQGSSRDSPRHAGHLIIRLSAPASGSDGFFSASSAGSSHVVIGSGMEVSATSLLGALPWDVRVDDGTPGAELFGALGRLADPKNTQVGRRPGVPLVGVAWQPGLPWRLERGKPAVSVRLDVYLMPEIFELKISTYSGTNSCFYDIWLLFDNLVPTKPFKPTPRPPPVAADAALAPCGAAAPARHRAPPSAHAFTLAGLMRAMESAGYDEMDGPDGLNLELYPFQRQSLKWMYDRETQPGGLNSLFWREHPSDKGRGVDHSFWYNPMAGELRAAKPPVVTGGFLCEEMGLGKARRSHTRRRASRRISRLISAVRAQTVEMCALILANPYVSSGPQQGRAPLRQGIKDANRPMRKTKARHTCVCDRRPVAPTYPRDVAGDARCRARRAPPPVARRGEQVRRRSAQRLRAPRRERQEGGARRDRSRSDRDLIGRDQRRSAEKRSAGEPLPQAVRRRGHRADDVRAPAHRVHVDGRQSSAAAHALARLVYIGKPTFTMMWSPGILLDVASINMLAQVAARAR